jgi:hypothetical protein
MSCGLFNLPVAHTETAFGRSVWRFVLRALARQFVEGASYGLASYREIILMASMIAEYAAEVRVRCHSDIPECDVVITVRGKEMSLRCRDYNQAVKWARIECKAYRIAGGFTVER